MDIFRVRLNCIDHYQATPTVYDPKLKHGSDHYPQPRFTPKVPVIRVFGATETGQKVCAHIHGAFPYLYIEYTGSLEPAEVDSYISRLHLSIDHALASSYRRNIYDGKTAYVAHITLVKGVPFYGYRVGYSFFFKIYLLDPLHMTRLVDLLRQGAVMNMAAQPYESHMEYLLQWMCDYNLYGCAYIDCSKVMFRSPVPDFLEIKSMSHRWHDRSIPDSLIAHESVFPRQSHCSIEVDICVQDILNRLDTKARPLHHDFVERVSTTNPDEKLVHSMAGLWRDETRRRKARMPDPKSGSSPFPPEVLISVSADPRNTQPGGWIHEAEYMERMLAIVKDEKEQSDKRKISFDSFVQPLPMENRVKTAFESIEDFFPIYLPGFDVWPQSAKPYMKSPRQKAKGDVEVDESCILSIELEDFDYDSDEEVQESINVLQNERNEGKAIEDGSDTLMTKGNDQSKSSTAVTNDVPLQSMSTNQLSEANSSAELDAAGIRNAGDHDHVQDDAFEIPSAYASDISFAIARHERTRSLAMAQERPVKRRKVFRDEVPSNFRQVSADSFDQNRPEQTRVPIETTRDPHDDPMLETGENDKASRSELQSQNLRYSSQELSIANGGDGIMENVKPSFQIVKDSQDPYTIRKLSHRSNSSNWGSQKSKDKHASFDTTLDAESEDSTIPKSSLNILSGSSICSSQCSTLAMKLYEAFDIPRSRTALVIANPPPLQSEVESMMRDTGVPTVIYQDAYYSDERDVPGRPREYAGKEFRLESTTVPYLPDFDPTGLSLASTGEKPRVVVNKAAEERNYKAIARTCALRTWEIGEAPPTRLEVQQWLESGGTSVDREPPKTVKTSPDELSQVEGPSQKNQHGFKYSQKQASTSVQHETQYMSLMSLEIHVNTRGSLVPDPERDEISCIFWCLQSEDGELILNGTTDGVHVGILALSENGGLAHKISRQTSVEVEEESTELDLINRIVDIVRDCDPDVLTGFEVHGGSWGYMIERARHKYEYDLCDEFSRTKSESHGRYGKENDKWGFNQTSTIRITGRHMINIWRAMRGELNLLQYTMENIVFHLLHRRVPHFAHSDLTTWYNSSKPKDLGKVIDYYVSRVQLDLEILEENELIPRVSEQARLLGVDFFSVISRGSQFKVESLMFRIAKPENFILVSPSRKQVGQQNALECLPLVMEPQSAFYNSPLVVLDFQSLYPSVMIAYNYCYSTFLGRVVNWRGQNKMGFAEFKREERIVELLKDHINIAPNGMMYVKPEIRKSLLAKMLGEILETRVMVKSGMKVDKEDKTLQRLLNNRQLALKLIANVTYGYTSASFSGRMPCSEIADSIVQTGRETLERAIALIHSVERWGAEVVYGDTDSLFVYLRGRTKDEAFDIGNEMAKTITDMNPRPVKLKFEKVYLPSILLAKKRYVGFKYESKSQKEPEFDAKGIETVRRDGTPAEQKIEEKALKILFRTADLSQVKSYFQKQCTKIMKGKISIQDFCFAKEVKLGTYSDRGPPPPGALISTRRMLKDPRAEPQYGERVPYVVITGAPGARLIDRCVAPDVLLQNNNNELDSEYYISKNLIPPLERIFNLVGANVRQWYDEMPKIQRIRQIQRSFPLNGKAPAVFRRTLEFYMKSSACVVCQQRLEKEAPICRDCMQRPDTSLLKLRSRINKEETKAVNLERICRSCTALPWGEEVRCDSKDCPVFYTRMRHNVGLDRTRMLVNPAMKLLEDAGGPSLEW